MPTHPIEQKLERDVYPYLVTARRLRRQWFYQANALFTFVTDVVVALAAVGVSTPLLLLIGGPQGKAEGAAAPTLGAALHGVPASAGAVIGALVVLWITLRVTYNRQEGQKRAVLARSCTVAMRQIEARLPRLLATSDPMEELTKLLDREIAPTVDRHIQEQAWPWTPFAPGIDPIVHAEVRSLCQKFESGWTLPATEPELRRVPA